MYLQSLQQLDKNQSSYSSAVETKQAIFLFGDVAVGTTTSFLQTVAKLFDGGGGNVGVVGGILGQLRALRPVGRGRTWNYMENSGEKLCIELKTAISYPRKTEIHLK